MTPDYEPQAEPEQEQPRRPFRLPPHRTFIVRKYATAPTEPTHLVEIVVKAHRIQVSESGRVDFIDFELDAEGPTMRLHRVLFNVEDVEDIDRVPPPSAYLITH